MEGKGEWGVDTVSLIWNHSSLGSRSKWKEFYTRNVASKGIGTTIKPQVLPWFSTDEGMLVMKVKKGKRRLVMLLCFAATWWRRNPYLCIDVPLYLVSKIHLKVITSATPSAYPSICLEFFVSSWRFHLDLQTLKCLFFSFGFFFWLSN